MRIVDHFLHVRYYSRAGFARNDSEVDDGFRKTWQHVVFRTSLEHGHGCCCAKHRVGCRRGREDSLENWIEKPAVCEENAPPERHVAPDDVEQLAHLWSNAG